MQQLVPCAERAWWCSWGLVHVSFMVFLMVAQVQRDMHLKKLVESVHAAHADDCCGFAAVKVHFSVHGMSQSCCQEHHGWRQAQCALPLP